MTPALLKTIRRHLGLSQRELAEALGLRRNTITRWECGLAPISHPILLKLSLERLIHLCGVQAYSERRREWEDNERGEWELEQAQ